MLNDRNERDEHQDEGEYHFSDDQVSYDMEAEETAATQTTAAPKSSLKDKLSSGFNKHRRIIIGIGVFIVLAAVVYKMLAPAATTSPTDFSQTPVATNKPIRPNVPAQPVAPAAQPQQPALAVAAPGVMPSATEAQQPQPAAPVATTPNAPQPVGPQYRSMEERLAYLEAQNAKLMNLVESQITQKIADYDTQNAATQSKIQDLSTRLGNIENSLSQITNLMQRVVSHNATKASNAARVIPSPLAVRSIEPKSSYSVQAIIPGRAWLKSDAGDTVTVAEGDVIKQYGRVTKIDPYDGVVEIDTGSRVVALSYGASGD